MITHRVQQYKPGDFSLGQVHEFLGAFGRQGGTPELLQDGIEDEELMNRLICFWQSGNYESTTAQKVARAIMGTNFLGIEEATRHFGVKPTKAQLAKLAEIPFTEAELQECRDTHILVAVFPMSILDIWKRVPRKLFFSHDGTQYNTEPFAKKRGKAQWHLILKIKVPNSTVKIWDEQRAVLTENEEVPTAREMVYIIIGHYLATGERLFESVYVRCADLGSVGIRVSVGYFDRFGLHVYFWRDDDRYDDVGLASSRKF